MKTIKANHEELIKFLNDWKISMDNFYNIDFTNRRSTLMAHANTKLLNNLSDAMNVEPKLTSDFNFELINETETIRIVLTLN